MGFLDDLAGPDAAASAPPPETAASASPPVAPEKPAGGFLESLDQADTAKKNTPEAAPNWSDVPLKAAMNAPGSALEFGKNIVHPFMHPIDTLESIGNLALGLYQKAGLYGGHDYEKAPEAVGKMLVDRYGSIDNVKKTLANDPIGAAADLSMVLTGGGSAVARLPGIAGRVGEVTNTVGRAVDPINAVANTAKGIGTVGEHVLAHQTGLGPEAIKEMAGSGFEGGARGQTFRENMRDQVPMENVVDQARAALDKMRKERGDDYNAGMAGTKADTTILDWSKIGDAIRDSAGISNFKGVDIKPATAAVRSQLNDIILDWMARPQNEFHTPAGFDALKQQIGDIRDDLPAGSPAKLVANKYYGAVRQTIIDQVPEYAKTMQGYEEASDQLKQIERTLSLPQNERKQSIDTALRKLQSTLRNNVNTNYGQRAKLVEYLENNGAPNLKAALAGQSANSFSPRGLQKVGAILGAEGMAALAASWFSSPAALAVAPAMLAASSPRIVGEAVHGAARLAKPLSYVVNRPMARTGFQVGRVTPESKEKNFLGFARGGAVDRALRIAKRGS